MKKIHTNEKLFAAFDLHSNNNYLAIINKHKQKEGNRQGFKISRVTRSNILF